MYMVRRWFHITCGAIYERERKRERERENNRRVLESTRGGKWRGVYAPIYMAYGIIEPH